MHVCGCGQKYVIEKISEYVVKNHRICESVDFFFVCIVLTELNQEGVHS